MELTVLTFTWQDQDNPAISYSWVYAGFDLQGIYGQVEYEASRLRAQGWTLVHRPDSVHNGAVLYTYFWLTPEGQVYEYGVKVETLYSYILEPVFGDKSSPQTFRLITPLPDRVACIERMVTLDLSALLEVSMNGRLIEESEYIP